MRLGVLSQDLRQSLTQRKNIWIHAVSVGEVQLLANIMFKIKTQFPDCKLICSTVTKTGFSLARERFPKDILVIYAPLDFSWVVRKFIRVINPRIYISTETEIWPNLFTFLHKNNTPIMVINGRISDQSFKGYKRIKVLLKPVLQHVNAFCMQSPEDARRIVELGAEQERVEVVGNLKFDNQPRSADLTLNNLGYSDKDWIFIAGSTHPGEEEMIISVYKNLFKEFPQLRLVVVPRHIERGQTVQKIISEAQLTPIAMSLSKGQPMDAKKVLVGDQIGQLAALYKIARIVFIGKTFAVGGGQNMLEPAFFGKAVFVGPLTQNFKDVMRILLEENAVVQVNTPHELEEKLTEFLRTPEIIDQMGSRAQRVIERNKGAADKTLNRIGSVIKERC